MKNAFSLKKPAFSGIGFITAIFIFGIALFITMEYYHIFTIKEKCRNRYISSFKYIGYYGCSRYGLGAA